MRTRAPAWDDAPAVLSVLQARFTTDLGLPMFRLEDVQDEWCAPDVELSRDALVVEMDGAIIGYALVRRPGAFAVVAPDDEGRGVGARLLQWVQERERERACAVHRQIAAATNDRARTLLEGAGYGHVRSYWRMARSLDRPIAAAAPPEGIALRTLDPDADARALHAMDAESFASAPDYVPESFEEFVSAHLRAHDLAPELSLVARDGKRIVGFLLARRWPHEVSGYIALLAVAPSQQRRGLGTALLTHGFAGFAATGLAQAQLLVASDNPRGLRVYEAAGMSQRFRVDIFERPVTPAAGPRAGQRTAARPEESPAPSRSPWRAGT